MFSSRTIVMRIDYLENEITGSEHTHKYVQACTSLHTLNLYITPNSHLIINFNSKYSVQYNWWMLAIFPRIKKWPRFVG